MKVMKWTSPAGELLLGEEDNEVCLCDWNNPWRMPIIERRLGSITDVASEPKASALLEVLERELEEYFRGERMEFDLPLRFKGTEFQLRVWNALLEIPYGELISYAELARRIGAPKAVRAVAGANAANLISILAPCHRVIASHGCLGGYSGGLPAKRHLLSLEGAFRHS